ncbi:MAG TPA: TIGR04283 family arsenosugar biosynthesis glycosyltransferase [Phycisphaerae bacterium]|nr:TIGR04283 family arsenosugar biosynthesis glycosyltransferase [Phycisphaerae bacterium]
MSEVIVVDSGRTVERRVKALLTGLRARKVLIGCRRWAGTSAIPGTIRDVWGAGAKILATIGEHLPDLPGRPVVQPERLIVFTRWPTPGETKTRLVPVLGRLRAAELQRRMTVRSLAAARGWASAGRRQIEVRHEGGSWRPMRRWLGAGPIYRPQRGGDLGGRMASALAAAFREGCRRAVLIGTDSPAITPALLEEAFGALGNHDLVLGPTLDGGYWLIGMGRPLPVFEGIAWGTDAVLDQTREQAWVHGLRVHLLPELADVDRPEDLPATGGFFDPRPPVISVVIPALNEAGRIAAAIRSARAPGVEILVADGGSADGTPSIAESLGARVIPCLPGRGRQQNAAAAAAAGDILLFLHADTVLPPGYAVDVFQAMLDGSAVGGGFLWRTDLDSPWMRAARFFVRLRTVYARQPWGDQAIFVRKKDFRGLGGFGDVPIAEDWDFVRALRRRGRLVVIHRDVVTSARRRQGVGVAWTFLANWLIVLGCRLGVPRSALARLYGIARVTDRE